MSTPRPSLPQALLRQALARRAAGPSTSAELLDDVLAAVETLPQRHAGSWRLAPELRFVPVLLAVAFLLTALIGLALFAGGRVTLPRNDSLMTYASGGDIYVGDPATGDMVAIVTGPEIDSGPIFSPDGTLIAFTRGDVRTPDHSLIVVRADGSEERVVMPAGFSTSGVAYAWTPDSRALVVNHDSLPQTYPHGDGELSLMDATGDAEPRLLTPPLSRWPGGYHPQIDGEIAPMFRPPLGDRLLSFPGPEDANEGTATLVEMDIDGSNVTELITPASAEPTIRFVMSPSWAPDGKSIVLVAGEHSCPLLACVDWDQNYRAFVMDADGTDLRRLAQEPAVAPGDGMSETTVGWSPDGSMVLLQRQTTEDVENLRDHWPPEVTFAFVAVEVATGAEHGIGSPYTIDGRPNPYPRWDSVTPVPTASWSFDSRSVLLWEGPGTRPFVVDVETGASTELPWASDSHPSWRFVAR